MAKFLNQLATGLKRRWSTRARTKYLAVLLLGLVVVDLAVEILLSFHLRDEASRPVRSVESDELVNTSYYREEYAISMRKRNAFKSKRDMENIEYKTVIPNARPRSAMYKRYYLIVEYTKIFGQTKYCGYFDPKNDHLHRASADELEKLTSDGEEAARNKVYLEECPYRNCRFTCDSQKAESADALLFHYDDLNTMLSFSISSSSRLKGALQASRAENNQIWIIWNDEPAEITSVADNLKMNWTLSYRFDSEVSECSYGCTYNKHNLRRSMLPRASKSFVQMINQEFKERQNSAVWFVSNCKALFRINFYIRLHEHIPTKVFGGCANSIEAQKKEIDSNSYYFFRLKNLAHKMLKPFKAISYLFGSREEECGRNSECESREFTSNKFYLSFESRNCTNYITEKLWRILRTNMIPVVIQPSREIYETVAPPDSFIHAQDFDFDPQRLARYLNAVATNFDLYLKHLSWKFNYDVVFSERQTERRRMCDLCTKLNQESSVTYYESLSAWSNSDCR